MNVVTVAFDGRAHLKYWLDVDAMKVVNELVSLGAEVTGKKLRPLFVKYHVEGQLGLEAQVSQLQPARVYLSCKFVNPSFFCRRGARPEQGTQTGPYVARPRI